MTGQELLKRCGHNLNLDCRCGHSAASHYDAPYASGTCDHQGCGCREYRVWSIRLFWDGLMKRARLPVW